MKGFFSLFLSVCLFFNVNIVGAVVVPVDPADTTAHIKKETSEKNKNALAVIKKYKSAIKSAGRTP